MKRRTAPRLLATAVLGVAAGAATWLAAGWELGVVTGWAVFATAYSAWTWARLWPLDAAQTRAHAAQEDPGRGVVDTLLLVASFASIAAVGLLLLASESTDLRAGLAGVAGVAASWFLVHTTYGVRYCDLYYSALQRTGRPPIDFFDDEPNFVDFAYLTFCLGMTYQISDTSLKTRELRRTVLFHTLLSYFFGAVVLASTINLVVSLGSSGG